MLAVQLDVQLNSVLSANPPIGSCNSHEALRSATARRSQADLTSHYVVSHALALLLTRPAWAGHNQLFLGAMPRSLFWCTMVRHALAKARTSNSDLEIFETRSAETYRHSALRDVSRATWHMCEILGDLSSSLGSHRASAPYII